eukprot:6655815-Prymnesium_polylepis.1
MAWHGDPALLRRDGYSGDYGVGLYGYWRSAAAYVSCHADRGWECMLCDVLQPALPSSGERSSDGTMCTGRVIIAPRDALRRRAYVEPLGLTISIEGAQIVELAYDGATQAVLVSLQRHEAAPSAEATLFLVVERVFPPPPSTSRWRVECPDSPGCAREWLRSAAHKITMSGSATTNVSIGAHDRK